MRVFPAAALPDKSDSLLHMPGVRIAALDEAQRQSMGAENDVRATGFLEVRKRKINFLDNRLDVERMVEELFDDLRAWSVPVGMVEALPFLQTAGSSGEGILGIHGKQHEFLRAVIFHFGDSFRGKRIPV